MTTNHEEAARRAIDNGLAVIGLATDHPVVSGTAERLAALIAEVRRDVVKECAAICDAKAKLCATYLPRIVLEGAAEEIRAKLEEGK